MKFLELEWANEDHLKIAGSVKVYYFQLIPETSNVSYMAHVDQENINFYTHNSKEICDDYTKNRYGGRQSQG